MKMRTSRRLLRLAEMLCGTDVSGRVFEPLVADWSREFADARGRRRLRVLVSGSVAYTWTLLRCTDGRAVATTHPGRTFAAIVAAFSLVTVAATLLPLVQWRHWEPFTVHEVFWRHPAYDSIYFVPDRLAWGMTLALLPASLVAATGAWPWRKCLAGCALCLALIVAIDGWIAPAAWNARSRAFWARVGRDIPPESVRDRTLPAYIAAARSTDALTAGVARNHLQTKARALANAATLALLGFAIGRARRRRHVRVGPGDLALWWMTGAASLMALSYWAPFFAQAVAWPAAAGRWLPTLVLIAIGLSGVFAARRSREATEG